MADATNHTRLRELRTLLETATLKGNYVDAEGHLFEAEALAPNHPWVMPARVLLNARRRHWRKAFRAYADVLQKAPASEERLWSTILDITQSNDRVGFASAQARNLLYLNILAALTIGLGVAGLYLNRWPGLLAVIAVLLAVVIGLEIFYRCYLYHRFGIKGERHAFPDKETQSGHVHAISVDARVYHPVRGYDLRPNAEFVCVSIIDGRVVEAHRCLTDSNGNTGFTDEHSNADAINILVLGDSFTSNPGGGGTMNGLEGVEWPYFLKSGLTAAGLPNLRILNYARTGHGLLQMADTAADLLEKHRPDVVIFAFITHDITRYRYWHQSHTLGGIARSMRTLTPGGNVLPHLCEDQHLVDRRITWEWAQERLQRGDRDDLSNQLQRRYESLRRRTSLRDIDLMAPSRFYALDWLVFGTPFIDVGARTTRSGLMKMTENSFFGDAQFIGAINKIKKSGAEIVLLHLPQMGELEQGKMHILSGNQDNLMQSLTKITGEAIWSFILQLDKEFVRRKYPRSPYDEHPSLWAKRFFGESVVKLVRETALGAKFAKRASRKT